MASVALVDGAWFVESAQILALVVDRLSYSDDGVVSGAYTPRIGGMYTATIDDFGSPGPEETAFGGEVPPGTPPRRRGRRSGPRATPAPAVAVRFWQSPSTATPYPAAMFAEFIVPRGTSIEPTFQLDTALDTSDTSTDNLVAVPPLVGLTETQARVALDERGLLAAIVTDAVERGAPTDGTVVAQDPPAGQAVPSGATVTISIAEAQLD